MFVGDSPFLPFFAVLCLLIFILCCVRRWNVSKSRLPALLKHTSCGGRWSHGWQFQFQLSGWHQHLFSPPLSLFLSFSPPLSLFLSLCLLSLSLSSFSPHTISPYDQPILSRCDQHTWHPCSKCSLASLSFSQREAKRTGQRDPEGVGTDFLPIWFQTGGSRWGLKIDFNVNLGHIGYSFPEKGHLPSSGFNL